MNRRNRWLAVSLAAVTLAGACLTEVSAAPTGPGAQEVPRYDDQTMAQLTDNVIEYDEIELRVREYNPTISQIWQAYRDSKEDYAAMVTELESQYRTVKEMADEYVSGGKQIAALDPVTGATMVAAGVTLDKTYKSTVQGFRDTVNKWDTNKTNTIQIRQAEKQVTAGVQQAMIGYETIRQNIATLETMVKLYEEQDAMYGRMQALGLVTDKEVLSAQSGLIGARSQLMALQNQQESTRRTLCMLLGFDPDANPEIRPIPEFDMSRLDGMNLEEDTVKAIGSNYTLISQRTSEKGKTTGAIEARKDWIEEGEEKMRVEMRRLYEDVMDKKAAFEAAEVGLAAAESTRAASQRQYDLGLMSEVQFTGTEIAYYQKKAARDSANLSLLQSMENYDWALSGLATVE